MLELLNNIYAIQSAVLILTLCFCWMIVIYQKQKALLLATLHHDELLNDECNGMSKQIVALKDQLKLLQGLNDHQFDVLSKNATTIESLENEVRFLRDQQNSKPVTASVVDHMPKTSSTQPAKRRNRTRGNHPGVGKSLP